MIRSLLIALASAAAITAFATPASAETRTHNAPGYAIHVSYGDLDLNTDRGARRLLRRVNAAAKRACPATDPFMNPSSILDREACIDNAVDKALANLDAPVVLAMHEQRTGRTPHAYAVASN